jgi:hypothetical protein
MRRYTRLSNGFSRKIENHTAAVALNYFVYNFIRIHRTLRVTPAMAARRDNEALGSLGFGRATRGCRKRQKSSVGEGH